MPRWSTAQRCRRSPTRSPASSTDRIPASSPVRRPSRPPPPPPAPWPAVPIPITVTAGTLSAPNYSFTNLINGLSDRHTGSVDRHREQRLNGLRRSRAGILRSDHRLRQRTEFQPRHRHADSSRPPPPPPVLWPAVPTRSRSPQARSRLRTTRSLPSATALSPSTRRR